MRLIPGAKVAILRQRLRRGWHAVSAPVQRLVGWLRSPEFVTTSSSLAFYAMISLPPMVLLGFWIAGGSSTSPRSPTLAPRWTADLPTDFPSPMSCER